MNGKIGIWIDKRTAKITSSEKKEMNILTIKSSIEEFHPKGGSGSKIKGGPQDVVQDSKYLERTKHQYKEFFDSIAKQIKSADALVIFGPAQTGKKFSTMLSKFHPALFLKVKSVVACDSITDNQIKAWVSNYFSK